MEMDAETTEGDEGEAEGEATLDDTDQETGASQTPPQPGHNRGAHKERYRAFTTRFDQVEDAANLCDPQELERLRIQLDRKLTHLQGVVSRLANRLADWRTQARTGRLPSLEVEALPASEDLKRLKSLGYL